MKNIVTGTDMKKVDSYTINTIGIPSLVLMERAALSVAEIVCKNQLKDKKILVVAGVGNKSAGNHRCSRFRRDYKHKDCRRHQ